ncbi:nuclear transport factor 2 family protein [Kribbella sp. NPDC051770]|uniref:nuclear transport factor 2 family protein n=1 Tax=Kribbella sp. NPDC051770 TaxID=3155413 RepID=UPI003416D353
MSDQMSVEAALREAITRRAEALRTRDIATLTELFADDFTYVNSQGALLTKQAYLDFIEHGPLRFDQQTTDELAIRVHGNTAVVTCLVHDTGTWQGEPFDAVFRSTQTYVLREDAWLYVAGQTTALE